MMNRTFFRAAALTLCLTMLCIVAAGCQTRTPGPVESETPTTTGAAVTTLTRPNVTLQDASGSVFIGTWNVSAKVSHMTSITFKENGTVDMVVDGKSLSGAFYVESDTELTLKDTKATYTVDGDTITITTDKDVWTLTKPE